MTKDNDLKLLETFLLSPLTKLGDIKKKAKNIKTDHQLALELWKKGNFNFLMLATLIMDKKQIDQAFMDTLMQGFDNQTHDEKHQILDWLFANQLMKSSTTKILLESWQHHKEEEYRRLFWYYQARLRWTGKNPLDNSRELTDAIISSMSKESPCVQWMMNFTAGWIGVYEPNFRDVLTELGEELKLYKDAPVSKGCTPAYLPEFIRIESKKRQT